GTEAPQVVPPARHLGLDHLGAELGHQHAAERTGDDLGELEHTDSLEWAAGLCHGAGVYLFGTASAIEPRASSERYQRNRWEFRKYWAKSFKCSVASCSPTWRRNPSIAMSKYLRSPLVSVMYASPGVSMTARFL